MSDPVCIPVDLPPDLLVDAAADACAINPDNDPVYSAKYLSTSKAVVDKLDKFELATMTNNRWERAGRTLSVQFMDNPNQATRRLILEAGNEWSKYGNIKWVETSGQGDVRIDRGGQGYSSFVGPQQLRVPANQPTMILQGVTENFQDWFIVTHEFGHSAGLQHEQLRRQIVERIIREAAYDYFWQTSHWSRQLVDWNVLTPLEERYVLGSPLTDEDSVMCYSLPGRIMRDGIAVRGGRGLSATDKSFFGEIYPLPNQPQPPTPPTPPSVQGVANISVDLVAKVLTVVCPDRTWTVRNKTP